ncbi:MAG: 2-succinyl-5-enolpyruvyl-6-hydroxy-3-cyclohexene-1-carboxylic-acid synthase [Solirubrobacteraceae bacterium]|nr:2-succinyl-5-enolpyruvyl-6-hydroxy-3-cyclohexene-1-carboxylic-acid synthase [Solirubrobacteraceae bacterium]
MHDPTDTYLLLRALCDELGRCGIAGAVTSPGSRSTPLVLSLVRDGGFPCVSQIDERSAGYFALGMAKATGRPAVLACTSGTAAANYLPAVVEARESRVPLVVLSADRPAELRRTGAGQAIDQIRLYGDHVKLFEEVGVEQATLQALRWIRALACRAVAAALDRPAGPVHLNFPLREPLVLGVPLPAEEPGGGGRPDGRPWVARLRTASDPRAAAAALEPIVAAAPRGVLVLGRHERPGFGSLARAASAFGAASGWPLLADPLSGARSGPGAIAHYDALLRSEAFADAARPTAVLRAGDLPTSKPLREWLAGLDAIQVLIDPDGARQDPAQVCDLSLAAEPVTTLEALADAVATTASPWLGGWLDADARAAQALAGTLGSELSEPRVALELGAMLPAEATLVVAASMPVRDIETTFPVRDDPPRVLANRGANGIDGTIATAYGVAAASEGPVVLLLGDVTFAHDVGSLLTARRSAIPLTIVLLDNGGGGIFDFLPVSTERDAFETHVATPTGLDVAGVAQAFGLHLLEVATLAELRAALDHGLTSEGTQLLHVRCERAANVELHRRMWDAVRAALAAEH